MGSHLPPRRMAHASRGELLAAMRAAPPVELVALVWGPRFDREHARELVAHLPHIPAHAMRSMDSVADRFDALPSHRQQRVRQRLLRQCGNSPAAPSWTMAHAPHPADR